MPSAAPSVKRSFMIAQSSRFKAMSAALPSDTWPVSTKVGAGIELTDRAALRTRSARPASTKSAGCPFVDAGQRGELQDADGFPAEVDHRMVVHPADELPGLDAGADPRVPVLRRGDTERW